MGLFTGIEKRLFTPIAGRFRGLPVLGGAVAGLMVAALALLWAIVLIAALAFYDKVMQTSEGGVSMITGFVIMPLVMLAGLPWSYLVMKAQPASPAWELLLAGSVLLNGLIIGGLAGFSTRLSARRHP